MSTTEERELLRETVAALVAKHAGPAAVRAAMLLLARPRQS